MDEEQDREGGADSGPKPLSPDEISQIIQREAEAAADLPLQDILRQFEQEYADAEVKPVVDWTEEDWEKYCDSIVELERSEEQSRPLRRIRGFLEIGIKTGASNPEGELFQTAKELMSTLDQFEADDPKGLTGYESTLKRYTAMLAAKCKK